MGAARTTMYLEDKDRRALEVIQDHYGLATLSDAIRFSLRVVQGLAPPESAVARHLPVGRPRQRWEPGTLEAFMAQAQQTRRDTQQFLTQAKAFLHQHCPRPGVHPPGLHRQVG